MSKSELVTWKVRVSAISLLLAVFTAGAVAGGAGYRFVWLDARRDEMPQPPGELGLRLRQLDLSDAQQTQVRAVFENHRPKLDAVLRETFPKVRAVQEQIDAEIVKLLTDEQRHKFLESAKRGGPPPIHPPRDPEGFSRRGPRPFGEYGPMPPFGGPPDAAGSALELWQGPGFPPPRPSAAPSAAPSIPKPASSAP